MKNIYELSKLGLKGNDVYVYLYLLQRTNIDTMITYPSVDTISADLQMNRKTVMACIKKLEEVKIVTVDRKNKKANRYTVEDYNPHDFEANTDYRNHAEKNQKIIKNEPKLVEDKKEKEIIIMNTSKNQEEAKMKKAKFTKPMELYKRYNKKAMEFEQAFMDGGFEDDKLAKKSKDYRKKADFYKSNSFIARKK